MYCIRSSQDVVGVIVKIEMGSCRLLTSRGIMMQVRLQDIGQKRSSKFATALDSNQNTVRASL